MTLCEIAIWLFWMVFRGTYLIGTNACTDHGLYVLLGCFKMIVYKTNRKTYSYTFEDFQQDICHFVTPFPSTLIQHFY